MSIGINKFIREICSGHRHVYKYLVVQLSEDQLKISANLLKINVAQLAPIQKHSCFVNWL